MHSHSDNQRSNRSGRASIVFFGDQAKHLLEPGLPLTPVQREIVSHIDERQESPYVSFTIPLPAHVSSSIDLIQHAWRAVASHNSVLRTRLDVTHEHWRQITLRSISQIQFSPTQDTKTSYHGDPAGLAVVVADGKLSASLRIHRALIDDLSLPWLYRDFESFFNGEALDRHADFESFIRRTTDRDENAAKLFWRAQFSGRVSAPLHGFPTEVDGLPSHVTQSLSQEDMALIRNFAGGCKESVQNIFYGSWAAVLATHTEAANHLVTFAIVGRDTSHNDNSNTLGPLDQLYPLAVDMQPKQALRHLVRNIAQNDKQASKFAFIGYDSILDQASELSGLTLINVRACGSKADTEHMRCHFDRFNVIVDIVISDVATISIHHSHAVSATDVKVVLDHYLSAIRSFIKSSASTIEDISLTSDNERDYLLDLAKPLTEPVEGLVHKLFEEQAEKTPNLPAVQFETDQPLSYSQLNRLANGVARQLPSRRGALVPVCVNRSTNLIVALCAILKAGGGYVTTDPAVPQQRNLFIYQDVSAEFAIVDRSTKGTFPNEIVIEDLVESAGNHDQDNLNIQQAPDDIVYVIYTSGSTGSPKGVLLEHRAAYSGLAAFPKIPDLRQLLFHNPVFSAAQRSIWSTLKQGGVLCLASREGLTVGIGKTINSMNINIIDVTPSTAQFITPGTVPSLTRMTVAGELINPALVPLWVDQLELMNAYGLSENTQFNWRHVIQAGQNPQDIGRPIDTTTAYVLKPGTTELSPLLVPGELCLGGHQLARGYLNRPEKTAEAFISNPFGLGRLYRTGDLVLTHANGSIEMIGRIDFSVKINDQRVDPGESNSTIQLHKQVRDSAVVAASVSGRMSLVAVIVPDEVESQDGLLKELREQLEKQLPSYMIPSYWTFRDDLPLNINGKVDIPALRKFCEKLGRKGLQRIQQNTDQKQPVITAVTYSSEEKMILSLFSEALSIPPEQISLTTSFVDLGGTSLEAIKVSAAALQAGLEINATQLLLGQSVADIAKVAATNGVVFPEDLLRPFELAPKGFEIDEQTMEDVLPATPFQEGLIADSIRGKTDYMLPKFLRLGVTLFEMKEALQRIVASRPILRTTFASHGNSFVQVVQKQLQIPAQRTTNSPDTYLSEKAASSARIGLEEPLIRLVGLADDVVVIETHHALVDSWSYHYIFDDLKDMLRDGVIQPRAGFGNYVKYLANRDAGASREFWKTYLDGAQPTVLAKNEDHPSSASIELDLDITPDQGQANIASSALYTAWSLVLSAWLDIEDVLFIVNVSGREAPVSDILQIQGPTMSTVPMRVRIGGSSTLRELSGNISEDFWRIADHAHLGLRNILKTFGNRDTMTNAAANFLISMQDSTESLEVQEIDIGHQNANDLVTIEMDSKDLRRVKIFSNHGVDHIGHILDDMKFVLSAHIKDASVTVDSIRSSIGPKVLREVSSAESDFSAKSEYQNLVATSVSSSSATDSSYDELDDILPKLATGDVQSKAQESHHTSFDKWGKYLLSSESTLLEPFPLASRQAVKSSLPFVKLRAAALRMGVSTEAIMVAAFGIILNKHTSTMPLFGLLLSDKANQEGMDQEAPYFVPQRIDLSDRSTLRSLARSVGSSLSSEQSELPLLYTDQASDFASHHSTAFDSFVRFSPPRNRSFGAQSAALPFRNGRHSSYTVFEVTVEGGRVDLTLSSRTSSSRCQHILEQISTVVQACVISPTADINSLKLVGPTELEALHSLAKFKDPDVRPIYSYFERFAAETPHAIALQFENAESLTYKETNQQANLFARYLRDLGLGPGSMVALYLEKSTDMIIAILAVVKAGAAYVPLGPENPAKRNKYIVDDIEAKVVISHSQFADFDVVHNAKTVFVDTLPTLDHLDPSNLPSCAVDSAAYCIYTSGSTGAPKGVCVPHRAISVSLQGHLEAEQTSSKAKHLLFANYTFDVSVHDIFFILGSGATLCVASTKRLMTELPELINSMQVTQTFLTPTVARLLSPEAVPGLRTLICSGEALTSDIIDAWSPTRTLLNLYGPTECAVNVTAGYIRPDTKYGVLGKPISTASIMIMEKHSTDFAPLGAVGEICVAGSHLATGYLKRDDLTAKAFVPCPLPGVDRMYRTGDLGKWLSDGNIQYLGRIDHQIKLNGHRIELEEIEQVVVKNGLTQECVAAVLDKLRRPQLALFCAFETSAQPGLQSPASPSRIEELKESFSSLAHYMVPHYIFPVGSIPRSGANKTDRKALKQMVEALGPDTLSTYSLAAAQGQQGTSDQAVSTSEERVLQSVWANMFNLEASSIGAGSNFAVLGGDSISAINLVSACRKAGYSLDVNDILTLNILKEIAATMQKTGSDGSTKAAAKKTYEPPAHVQELLDEYGLEEEDVEYIYPCPPGQTEFLLQGHRKNQSWVVTAVRSITTNHSAEEYLGLLQTLTRQHDVLRTTFTSVPGQGWVGVVLKDAVVNFSIRNCERSEKDTIVAGMKRRRFKFGEPFVRYQLLVYPSGERDLVIKMDHGLWDGTSLRIADDTVRIFQETGAMPLQTPFKDFIWSEYQGTQTAALDFWKPLAKSLPAVSPRKVSRPEPQTNRILNYPVPDDINAGALARAVGVTPATLFQGLFQVWLADTKLSGAAAYDYLLTGRNVDLPDPQSIPGPCANFLPFQVPVPRDGSLSSYLTDTQSFFWRATKFANVGLSDIFQHAGLKREEVANKVLFLFQPFEPAPAGAKAREDMRWLVLGLSQAHMPQPYELVEEVHKTAGEGYKLVIKYDGESYSEDEVKRIAERQVQMLRKLVERRDTSKMTVQELL